MRVLPDESVPRQLAPLLANCEVATVPSAGWAGLKNGELIRRAAAAFDVFVTGDHGLPHQQNLPALDLGVVVVVAKNNRVETYVDLAPQIEAAVHAVD